MRASLFELGYLLKGSCRGANLFVKEYECRSSIPYQPVSPDRIHTEPHIIRSYLKKSDSEKISGWESVHDGCSDSRVWLPFTHLPKPYYNQHYNIKPVQKISLETDRILPIKPGPLGSMMASLDSFVELHLKRPIVYEDVMADLALIYGEDTIPRRFKPLLGMNSSADNYHSEKGGNGEGSSSELLPEYQYRRARAYRRSSHAARGHKKGYGENIRPGDKLGQALEAELAEICPTLFPENPLRSFTKAAVRTGKVGLKGKSI